MITVLAVLGRKIVEPPFPDAKRYIDFDHIVAGRFPESMPIGDVLDRVKAENPTAKSFEFYRPNSDHSSVERL